MSDFSFTETVKRTIAEMHDEIAALKKENNNLRERITTQKQTIQSYRDESREWREAAEHAQADNAKLRELVSNCHGWLAVNCEKGYVIPRNGLDAIEQSMHELGIEVE